MKRRSFLGFLGLGTLAVGSSNAATTAATIRHSSPSKAAGHVRNAVAATPIAAPTTSAGFEARVRELIKDAFVVEYSMEYAVGELLTVTLTYRMHEGQKPAAVAIDPASRAKVESGYMKSATVTSSVVGGGWDASRYVRPTSQPIHVEHELVVQYLICP